jgi:molybdenum cofactor biosynthesis enzyme MoaA
MCRHERKPKPTEQEKKVNHVIYEQILRDITKITFLELTGDGEPFYSQEIRTLLGRLADKDLSHLALRFITNGQLLDEKRWDQIEALGVGQLRISVSIDAASRGTYESIRRGGKWETLLRTMDMLAEKRASGKLNHLQVTYCVMKRNLEEMIPFVALARGWNCDKIEFQRIFGDVAASENIFHNQDRQSLAKLSQVMQNEVFREDWIEALSLFECVH